MRKKIISAMLALCMAGSLLTGCGTSADAEKKSKDSGDVTTVKWFTSRPVDGAIDQVMHETQMNTVRRWVENGRLNLKLQLIDHHICRN